MVIRTVRRVRRAVAGATVVVIGAGAVVVLGAAAGGAVVAPVSQAWGSALTVGLGGRSAGSGEFAATHDGSRERTTGSNAPALPLVAEQDSVVGGSLGQDAIAQANGTSAACAGLVGRNGSVVIGRHGSCLVNAGGRADLSLGSLSQLGLADALTELPDLPEIPELPDLPSGLPDLALRIEGTAVTAECSAGPNGANGSSGVADARVVGDVAGQTFPVATIPPDGFGLGLDDLLAELPSLPGIPGLDVLLDQLDQLPAGTLPANDLLTVTTDEQIRERGRVTVTALHVAVVPETLADVRVGKVTCGPNRAVTVARLNPSPAPAPGPSRMPTAIPAGLTTAAGGSGSYDGLGFGTLGLLGLAGLMLGSYLHRRRGPRTTGRHVR